MRRRLGKFLPIVLIAVLVQIFAPIGATWAASIAASDPLRAAVICHGNAASFIQPGRSIRHSTAPMRAAARFAAWFTPARRLIRRRPPLRCPGATPSAWFGSTRHLTCSVPGQVPTPRRARPRPFPDPTNSRDRCGLWLRRLMQLSSLALAPVSGFSDVSSSCPGWRERSGASACAGNDCKCQS